MALCFSRAKRVQTSKEAGRVTGGPPSRPALQGTWLASGTAASALTKAALIQAVHTQTGSKPLVSPIGAILFHD